MQPGPGVVSQAGAVVLVETARATGLDRELSRALDRWRRPGSRHASGKGVLGLAVALAGGGDGLARAVPPYAQDCPSPLQGSSSTRAARLSWRCHAIKRPTATCQQVGSAGVLPGRSARSSQAHLTEWSHGYAF